MRLPTVSAFAAFGLLLLGCSRTSSQADTTSVVRDIAPGITYTQETTTGAAPLIVHVLRIDRHARGVRVAAGQALDVVSYSGTAQGRETVSRMAARTGAVAAINGDYFPFNGDPTSLEIRDGELISEPIGFRVALGLTADSALMQILTSRGTVKTADRSELVLNGINHLPHEGETVLLSATYHAAPKLKQPATVVTLTGMPLPVHVSRDLEGKIDSVVPLSIDQPLPPCPLNGLQIVGVGVASAPLAMHCKPGDSVTVRYDLLPSNPKDPNVAAAPDAPQPVWQDVQQAIGGGPWLVRDGKVFIDGKAEKHSLKTFVNFRHPRSAVGICQDGSLLLVAVDGRHPAISQGVTLPELAEIMKRFGAVQAINLDGGGSTAMVVSGNVVNMPSDGRERSVANGLLVFADTPAIASSTHYAIQSPQNPALTLRAGETLQLTVVTSDGKPVKSPILWGTRNGLGLLDAQGVFHAVATGTGTALALIGNERVSAAIHVLAGTPVRAKATFAPAEPGKPLEQKVTLTVLDTYSNPVPQVAPMLTVEGGTMEALKPTDDKGQTLFTVKWTDGAPKRLLHITLPGQPTVDVSPTDKPVSEPAPP